MAQITRRYSDFDLDFKAHPVTGDISILSNDISIKRSVRNLISTMFFERPFHPEIGCNISRLLFEPMSNATALEIRSSIFSVLTTYEPRVTLNGIDVNIDFDNYSYEIKINYIINGYTTEETITIFLNKVR